MIKLCCVLLRYSFIGFSEIFVSAFVIFGFWFFHMSQLENLSESPDLYVGVTKRRNFSFGSEKPRSRISLEYHGVVG